MRILVDCDGVLADLDSYFLAWLRQQDGIARTPEDLWDFDYVRSLSIPHATEARFWAEVAHQRHCERIAPFKGAREFVAALQAKHDVRALTATSNAAWTGQRAEWLERVVGIQARHQIICGKAEKPYVDGDVLIEDALHNVEAWTAAGPQRWCVLMDRACNRARTPERTFRAHSYDEAIAFIEGPKGIAL